MKRWLAVIFVALLVWSAQVLAFDHSHAEWTALLKKNVVWVDDGHASQVRYAAFQADREKLEAYLTSLSAVSKQEFDGWSKAQRLAFLINAYNAFTVEKILTRYPNLKSIRDFGIVFGNPWKDAFFTLLGKEMTLDGIEHDTIRKPGAYDDPRIHMAVNCASIGCPALRDEAYVAERLDTQLDDQVKRFLSDRSRNRFVADSNTLEVSKIFDWYGVDFRSGYLGIDSLPAFLGRYAAQLAPTPEQQSAIRDGKPKIAFLEYDWALNDVK